MSLSLRGTLGDGLEQLRTVNGTLFVGLMFLLTAAMESVLGGLRSSVLFGSGLLDWFLSISPVSLSVAGPGWLLVLVLAVLFLATASLTLVIVRSFVAGETDRIPRSMLQGLPFAVVRLVLAGLLVLVLTLMGSVFLVIPGLFLLVSFMFYTVFVSGGTGAIEALRGSWGLASGNRLKLFGLAVVLVVITAVLEVTTYLLPYPYVGLLVGSVGTVYALAVIVEAYKRLGGGSG